MIAAKSLQEVVYHHLFPGGSIPLAQKDIIPAIDARVREIELLAKGEPIIGESRRLTKTESSLLIDRIIELRDICNPPMGYREIMRRLGNAVSPEAARNRYDDAMKPGKLLPCRKEGYAVISGEAVLAGTYTTPPDVLEKVESRDQFREATKMIHGDSPEAQEIREIMKRDGYSPVAAALKAIGPRQWDGPGSASELAAMAEDGKSKEIGTDILPAAQPALLEAMPEDDDRPYIDRSDVTPKILTEPILPEHPTTRNSRIVQESEEVKLSPSQAAHVWGPKIPHKWDGMILTERDAGKKFSEIQGALQAIGIACHVEDVSTRYYVEKRKREDARQASVQPDATPDPSPPGVEGAQEPARANPRGNPNPEPKKISRYALSEKIWTMHKEGKTPKQIADDLCTEGYGYWKEETIRNRLTQQGAKL